MDNRLGAVDEHALQVRRNSRRGHDARQALRNSSLAAYSDILPDVVRLYREGRSSISIATTLNSAGHRTRGGCRFHAATVWRLLARHGLTGQGRIVG